MQKKYFFSFFSLFICLLARADNFTNHGIIAIVNENKLGQGEHPIFYGAATLENQRGQNGKAAYPNQDRLVIGSFSGKTACVLCDGHGKTGEYVAGKVVARLPKYACSYNSPSCGLESEMIILQNDFKDEFVAQRSGTTCVAAIISENKLTVGHVGDSRLLVMRNYFSHPSLLFSTTDHNLKEPTEFERVVNAGGFIHKVYVRNQPDGPGLAMTRSLGDVILHQNNIVLAQPDIFEMVLEHNDIIIVASDGLWDRVTNDEVIGYTRYWLRTELTASNSNSMNDICATIANNLTGLARSRGSIDDITCAVLIYG